ncbi:MAG TPA: hypothetical protein VGW74_17225, partial [Propionibacteriaceae bacterium]|nr:hypothetical protein [Propionibacteriaceae bacterium]
MSTTFTSGGTSPPSGQAGSSPGGTTPPSPPGQADPFASSVDDAAEGQVYTVTGQDWDSIVSEQA